MSARNAYHTSFEELDDSLKEIEGITTLQIATIKRTLIGHIEFGSISHRRVLRDPDSALELLSEIMQRHLDMPEYCPLVSRLFDDTPQYEKLRRLLLSYREWILDSRDSTDSDTDVPSFARN